MIGLLKKDLLILRRVYMKNFFLVLALYTVLGIALQMTSFFTLMSWMYGFYVMSLFSVDNTCRWDFYAATLPVSRKTVVTAKFLLLGLCIAAGFVYSLVTAPDKARSAMLLLLGLAGGCILAAASLGDGGGAVLMVLFGWMETSPVPGFSIITAATAVLCLVCWLVSCRIYERKEF